MLQTQKDSINIVYTNTHLQVIVLEAFIQDLFFRGKFDSLRYLHPNQEIVEYWQKKVAARGIVRYVESSSGGDPFSLMGTGLIPSLVQVEDIGLDIHKRDRSTSSESDASTEIIESEDDVNLEPDSTTKEERIQEESGFYRIEEKKSKHWSKRVREDAVEGDKGDTFTIKNWWKRKHCTGFRVTFFINNDVADKYITNKEKRENERRENECKELVKTSFELYGNKEDYGIDDLKEDRIEKCKALLKLCETLHVRRVCLHEYNQVFKGITRTINTIVRMDIELERRGSSKAKLEFESVDAVPSGSSAPDQVPKSDKSTAEASP